MTHVGPVDESSGTLSAPALSTYVCNHCHQQAVSVQVWESHCGGYEDYKYTCALCGHVWWIDGVDS